MKAWKERERNFLSFFLRLIKPMLMGKNSSQIFFLSDLSRVILGYEQVLIRFAYYEKKENFASINAQTHQKRKSQNSAANFEFHRARKTDSRIDQKIS